MPALEAGRAARSTPQSPLGDGECRKRYLMVAIDRRSRWVHLAVKDDETEASAVASFEEALVAFSFRVTHLLTERGRCCTADGFENACHTLGVEHRKTRPCTLKTNGPRPAFAGRACSDGSSARRSMLERFNGRVQREVPGITIAGHRDLEQLLAGFNGACNARRQRVLDGRSPEEVVRKQLVNPSHRPTTDRQAIAVARRIVKAADEVSQPVR